MITLYNFGPHFGLPDASPFCVKAEVLLKMSGLPYETKTFDVRKSPKHKLPFIDDGGQRIGDSTFIRWHLEKAHNINFDAALSPAERATAWAFEKLCDDNLYWATVHSRWMDDANFNAGPVHYFKDVPSPLRPLIAGMVRRGVRRDLHGQGFGRHSGTEIERIAIHGYDQIANVLGDKPFLMGATPCSADAAVFGSVGSILCPLFQSPIRMAVEKHANLVAYRDRCLARWYPDLAATGKI
jgi:glutathione S-transferase